MPGNPDVRRRTQQERREATIAKLIDATIESIVEDGYYRTSVAAISERAGLSGGAMFRHFSTRMELMARVAEEISERALTAAHAMVEPVRSAADPLHAATELLAGLTRSPLVAAWHELMVAARTDAELRAQIAPALPKFYDAIYRIADSLGVLEPLPEPMREIALFSMVHMFSGAALTGSVHPRPDLDAQRIPLAAWYFQHTPDL
ncbi:helix-turn-helix domain-containing protein [Nocardia sp. NPDC048505]|uniref:TetR/AcrR family transcriptional regulator n=1 Tax=unclassified Nocardia TaxID=2637762 RepID=UPI0033C4C897